MKVLRNEKIIIKPVEENCATWIPEGKDGRVRWENTSYIYSAPLTMSGIARILTKEEQEFLEVEIDNTRPKGWLSPYAEKNMWKGVNGYKLEIGDKGITLDLSSPIQYIKYRIAAAQTNDIAPEYAKRLDRKYLFYMESLSNLAKSENEKIDKAMKANDFFSKIRDSRERLRNLWLIINKGDTSIVPVDIKHSEVRNKIYQYLTDRLSMFLTIIEDEDYKYKIMYYRALETGAFERTSSDIRDSSANGKIIGTNMTDVISYIKKIEGDIENQQVFAKFLERIKY